MQADSAAAYFRQARSASHKEITMTTHTAHTSLPLTPKLAVRTIAGVLLAVAAGITALSVIDDAAVPTAPGSDVSQVDPISGVRDSWEGRIGPAAEAGTNGVRDSWMPPGSTDLDLGRTSQGR